MSAESLRLCRSYEHRDGWNVPADEYDVPVRIDPALPTRGEAVQQLTFNGYRTAEIVLREWDERVLLHEVLHVLLNPHLPPTENGHRIIAHVETALILAGWRLRAVEREGQDRRIAEARNERYETLRILGEVRAERDALAAENERLRKQIPYSAEANDAINQLATAKFTADARADARAEALAAPARDLIAQVDNLLTGRQAELLTGGTRLVLRSTANNLRAALAAAPTPPEPTCDHGQLGEHPMESDGTSWASVDCPGPAAVLQPKPEDQP